MASVDEVLRNMDSYNRKLLSNAIKQYEQDKSSKSLKEVASILRNWDEDKAKILLPDFMKNR